MEENQAITQGIVEGITAFGAFVKLPDGRKGLVHISEVARDYVRDVAEYLAVGDEVRVKVLGTDESGRVRLSIKQALPPQPRVMPQKEFDDVLAKFLQQSEERQLDLKRNIRKKNGGGRGR